MIDARHYNSRMFWRDSKFQNTSNKIIKFSRPTPSLLAPTLPLLPVNLFRTLSPQSRQHSPPDRPQHCSQHQSPRHEHSRSYPACHVRQFLPKPLPEALFELTVLLPFHLLQSLGVALGLSGRPGPLLLLNPHSQHLDIQQRLLLFHLPQHIHHSQILSKMWHSWQNSSNQRIAATSHPGMNSESVPHFAFSFLVRSYISMKFSITNDCWEDCFSDI